MFKAVEFPASVADLAASLADVDWDALTLQKRETFFSICITFCKGSRYTALQIWYNL